MTKTEIKEEVGDFVTMDEVEFVDVNGESFTNEFVSPKKEVESDCLVSIKSTEESSHLNSGLEKSESRSGEFMAKQYKCHECCLKFEEERLLQYHYRKCSGKVKKLPIESNDGDGVIFICSFCKTEFLEENPFKQHIKQCRTNCLELEKKDDGESFKSNKMLRCDKCNFTTNWNCRLKQHVLIHLNEKPFKCAACEFATANVTNLKNHVLSKHSDTEKRYKCEFCDHSTHLKGNMERHLLVHTGEKPHKCDECKYAAGRKSLLKNHVLAKHSGATKRYKCKVCGHSAHQKGDLLVHMFVHGSDKPFKCHYQDCGYEAATRHLLRSHVRFRHTHEKPFRCDRCEYSSSSKGDLKGHFKRKHSPM